MKLFLLWQNFNEEYDTYDKAIVAANSAEEAVLIHPDGKSKWIDNKWHNNTSYIKFLETSDEWVSPDKVNVEEIGTTKMYKAGKVVLASYCAG